MTHVEDKDKPIICTYPNCGKRFINAAGLASHEVTHLATHDKFGPFLAEHEREKPVVCNFPNCGKRFLNTAGLAGHEVTHRNFISQNMGAIFKNLSFNQLKSLGIFSEMPKMNAGPTAAGNGNTNGSSVVQLGSPNSNASNSSNSSASSQQQQQQQQLQQQLQHAHLLLAMQRNADSSSASSSPSPLGKVTVLEI